MAFYLRVGCLVMIVAATKICLKDIWMWNTCTISQHKNSMKTNTFLKWKTSRKRAVRSTKKKRVLVEKKWFLAWMPSNVQASYYRFQYEYFFFAFSLFLCFFFFSFPLVFLVLLFDTFLSFVSLPTIIFRCQFSKS